MQEGAAIALPHLTELMRGGATSDSLNQAAWAIARVEGLPEATYEQAHAALLVAGEQIDRWGVKFPTQRMVTANTMALVALRTERWREAVVHAQRAIELRLEHGKKESLLDYAFLAMAQHACGDMTAARDSLAHARTIYDARLETGKVDVVAKVLLAEATEMVGQ